MTIKELIESRQTFWVKRTPREGVCQIDKITFHDNLYWRTPDGFTTEEEWAHPSRILPILESLMYVTMLISTQPFTDRLHFNLEGSDPILFGDRRDIPRFLYD